MLLANFDRKEHLQHRAVSLRQHGFQCYTWDQKIVGKNLKGNFVKFKDELGRGRQKNHVILLVTHHISKTVQDTITVLITNKK